LYSIFPTPSPGFRGPKVAYLLFLAATAGREQEDDSKSTERMMEALI
jgi:hypothetical protein